MTPHDERLIAALNGLRGYVRCAQCSDDRRAVCVGAYEDPEAPALPACGVCCGHGNEDGWCVPIEDIVEQAVQSIQALHTLTAEKAQAEQTLATLGVKRVETVLALHEALGVEPSGDLFARIKDLRAAEQERDTVRALLDHANDEATRADAAESALAAAQQQIADLTTIVDLAVAVQDSAPTSGTFGSIFGLWKEFGELMHALNGHRYPTQPPAPSTDAPR